MSLGGVLLFCIFTLANLNLPGGGAEIEALCLATSALIAERAGWSRRNGCYSHYFRTNTLTDGLSVGILLYPLFILAAAGPLQHRVDYQTSLLESALILLISVMPDSIRLLAAVVTLVFSVTVVGSNFIIFQNMAFFGLSMLVIPRLLPRVFSLGECLFACRMLVGYLGMALRHHRSFSNPARLGFIGATATILTCIVMIGIRKIYWQKGGLSQTAHLTIISITFALTLAMSTVLFGGAQPAIRFITKLFGNPDDLALIGFWLLGVAFVLWVSSIFFHSPRSTFGLHSMRKFYHLVAVILFLPGFMIDPGLMRMAFSVAACTFVIVETIRLCNRRDGGSLERTLSRFVDRFRSSLDQGEAVLSHLFLLLGCAIPIWVDDSPLPALSGVLSLGLADAMAALVGCKYGRLRWPGSEKKTVEGSMAAILAIWMGYLLIRLSFPAITTTIPDWFRSTLAISLIVGLWEALNDQNDNLTLPIITYVTTRYFIL